MAMELRKTGISVVGDAPWGTHFCHFYETKQDLLDTLVPYFKVGLESKEFCVWVISNSELVTVEEAKGALAQAVPDLDRHLSNKNIEILNGLDWYLDKNVFNLQRVTSAWDAKLKRALARGYDGLRVSGDTFWLGKKDWEDFCSYEKQVNDSISDRRITLLCTYPLAKSGAAEILDVVQAHQFATARRKGEWEVIETPELAQATAEIKRLNEELEQRVIERTSELRVANEELRKEIAERKQAEVLLHAKENALQESQRLLEEAQRIAHVGHYEHDLETGVIVASDENYRILGLQPQDSITLSNAFELMHPDDRARVHQERNEAVRAGQQFEVEFRVVRPDGEVRYIHSQGDVIRDEHGRPRRTFGIAQDITDRKQAEDALRRSEDQLRLIIDTIPTMAWTIRPDGTVDFLNQRWMDYTGLSLEQYVEEPTGPIHPEDIPGVLEKWRAQMAVEEGYENEIRLRRADGEYRWFLVRTAPLHDEHGNLVKWYGVSIDIQDRKQAEDELRRQKEILQQIFDHLPVMITFVDADGRIKLVNHEWERTLGWSLEEIRQRNVDIFAECYPDPQYREEVLKFVAEAKGNWADFKTRVRDGRVIDTTFVRIQLSDGTRIGIGQDITERKRAEAELKRSEIQLAEAQHLANVGSWNWDLQSNTLNWSAELYRIFGVDPKTFNPAYEDFVLEFVHPEERAWVSGLIENSIKTREPFSFYNRILRPDGEERVIHARGNIVSDEHGDPIRAFGTAQDVTERKEAEQALREAEQKYRDIFENAGEGIFQSTPKGRYIVANPALARMYGFASAEELIRSRQDISLQVYVDPTRREEFKRQLDEQGAVRGFEHEVFRKDGSRLWISVNAHAVRDEQGAIQYYEGTARDINERKAAEEKLKANSEQLRALSARLQSAREEEGTRIARELHDQLGSALTSLKFDLELIRREEFPSGSEADLSRLAEKIDAMMQVIDRTIDTVRRISSELRPSVLDDIGLVAAIRWQAKQIETQAGIACHCEFNLKGVDLDQLQSTAIFRVFQEAMTNVLRHARAGRVDITLEKEQNELVMTIRDNGRGITAEEESDRRSLGLLGMRERVNLIGGTIHITGAEGKGTLIKVSVPL